MSILGIAVALRGELASLDSQMLETGVVTPLGDRVLLVLSGIGAARARVAARRLVDRGATALLSWGSAAALEPSSQPGTVLLPSSVIAGDGSVVPIDARWHERTRGRMPATVTLRTAPIAEAQSVLATAAEKIALGRRLGAGAADMESAALGGVARDCGLPFLAIRAIADDCMTSLPRWLLQTLDEVGSPRATGLLIGVLRHPADIPQLGRLARAFGTAIRSLTRIRERLGPDFSSPGPTT